MHPPAIVTQSPTIYNDVIYHAVDSTEENGVDCNPSLNACYLRGSESAGEAEKAWAPASSRSITVSPTGVISSRPPLHSLPSSDSGSTRAKLHDDRKNIEPTALLVEVTRGIPAIHEAALSRVFGNES
jgi:hypothetical protein